MIDLEESRRVLIYKRILLLVVVFATVCYVAATAQAQELLSLNLTPATTGITTGSWALETPAGAEPPSVQVSMVDPHFRLSDSPQTSTVQPSNYRPIERMDNPIVNSGRLGLAPKTQEAKSFSLVYDDSLHPESFFSFVETKFMLRESSLADSESFTNVNAVSAYPLLEINFAGGHLPVTLFNSSVRTNDARW